MSFIRVGHSQTLVAWQALNVRPIMANIHADDRRLYYRIQGPFLLILGPAWPDAPIRDDEERRCPLAGKGDQTHKAQTPYTVPSAASAKVAEGGQHSKAETEHPVGHGNRPPNRANARERLDPVSALTP